MLASGNLSGRGATRSLDIGRSPMTAGGGSASPEVPWSLQRPFLEHPQHEVPDAVPKTRDVKLISSHSLEGGTSTGISNCNSP